MNVRFTLTGTSPILFHNERLANPDDEIAKAIKAITDKRKKTEDDRRAIADLEWLGGIYTSPVIPGPVVPTGNIRRSIHEAAKITKQGKQVERALAFTEFHVPLICDGPRDLKDLHHNPAYRDQRAAGVGSNRVQRTRPCFRQWGLVADALLLEDVLDFADLLRIAHLAGVAIGLCDGRTIGFGKFSAEVAEIGEFAGRMAA